MKISDILDEQIFYTEEIIKEVKAAQSKDIGRASLHKLIMIETLLTVAVADMKEVMETELTVTAASDIFTQDIYEYRCACGVLIGALTQANLDKAIERHNKKYCKNVPKTKP